MSKSVVSGVCDTCSKEWSVSVKRKAVKLIQCQCLSGQQVGRQADTNNLERSNNGN